MFGHMRVRLVVLKLTDVIDMNAELSTNEKPGIELTWISCVGH
jgi:hypothetical protein